MIARASSRRKEQGLSRRERNHVPMNTRHGGFLRIGIAAAGMLLGAGATAQMQMGNHLIDGITGPAFTLTAKAAYLSTPEGNSIYFWGYAGGDGPAQYCGPTLIVNQGQAVTVTLRNELPVPTSIVFPGQTGVTAAGGTAGLLTREAPAKAGDTPGTVVYSFTAARPGTFLYNSGTRPDLQIEMGLVGALIVRPAGFDPMMPATWRAYTTADTAFDQEFLFLLTDMDDTIHSEVELQVLIGGPIVVDTAGYFPVYWFINGRAGPDTMAPAGAGYLPHQPYDCMPMMHPGEKLLMRVIGAGRDPHPLHHHGNNALVIARDGSPLRAPSGPGGGAGAGADLAYSVFTIPATPGGTTDAIFTWTGRGLGWDVRPRSGRPPGALRGSGGSREAVPRGASHVAGHDIRPDVQRQPVSRHARLAAARRGGVQRLRRFHVHVAFARGEGDRQQRHLPRRHDDHADDRALAHDAVAVSYHHTTKENSNEVRKPE